MVLLTVNRSKADQEKKEAKGYDGHKKINGRKRHIIVDTLGHVLSVHVTAANHQDRDMIQVLGEKMKDRFPRMQTLLGDSGYEGRQNKTLLQFGWLLSIVKRPHKKPGEKGVFKPIHKRWIVERTFAWLGIFRRLAVDFETTPHMAEACIQVAAIALALKKWH